MPTEDDTLICKRVCKSIFFFVVREKVLEKGAVERNRIQINAPPSGGRGGGTGQQFPQENSFTDANNELKTRMTSATRKMPAESITRQQAKIKENKRGNNYLGLIPENTNGIVESLLLRHASLKNKYTTRVKIIKTEEANGPQREKERQTEKTGSTALKSKANTTGP